MGVKVGVCMLLIAWGIIAVQGEYPAGLVKRGTCDWPQGTCYYINDPCPEGTNGCDQLSCDLDTNKCCCNCADPWKKFQSSCYLFLDQSSNWADAIAECSSRGAKLLSIKSQEEQDFVTSNLKGRSWLGMTDEVKEGEWIWLIDGSAVTYKNWAPGEPNNVGGVEDYGMLYADGQWNDTKKDQIRLIICQRQ